MKNFIVLSSGQLISADINKLAQGLAQKGFDGEKLLGWIKNNLAPLRLGQSLQDFHLKFSIENNVKISFEDFETIFNSMCEISTESAVQIKSLTDFLNQSEHDVQLILVSHTNWSHLNWILNQLQSIINPNITHSVICSDKPWDSNAKLLFATSMHSQCTDHPAILNFALNTLHHEDMQILSFLNTIQTFNHPSVHENFTYTSLGNTLSAETIISMTAQILESQHTLSMSYSG